MGILFMLQIIYDSGEPRWNDIDSGNRRTQTKIYPCATFSTNPTWTDPGSNLGLCGEGLATNCLGHSMVTVCTEDNSEYMLSTGS
jgi:hypothetical protein